MEEEEIDEFDAGFITGLGLSPSDFIDSINILIDDRETFYKIAREAEKKSDWLNTLVFYWGALLVSNNIQQIIPEYFFDKNKWKSKTGVNMGEGAEKNIEIIMKLLDKNKESIEELKGPVASYSELVRNNLSDKIAKLEQFKPEEEKKKAEFEKIEKMIREKFEIERFLSGADNCDYWFEDIIGLDEVKRKLKEQVYASIFTNLYGKKSKSTGILLYGPPGTGKTLIAKAVVNELNKSGGNRLRVLFNSITPGDLKSKYHGGTEKQIKAVFEVASKVASDLELKTREAAKQDDIDKKLFKVISIIFIDEFDAVAVDRDKPGVGDLAVAQVNALLQAIDGIGSKPNVIFMANTNYPWNLDAAILSRFGTTFHIRLPTENEILKVMEAEISKNISRSLKNYSFPRSGTDLITNLIEKEEKETKKMRELKESKTVFETTKEDLCKREIREKYNWKDLKFRKYIPKLTPGEEKGDLEVIAKFMAGVVRFTEKKPFPSYESVPDKEPKIALSLRSVTNVFNAAWNKAAERAREKNVAVKVTSPIDENKEVFFSIDSLDPRNYVNIPPNRFYIIDPQKLEEQGIARAIKIQINNENYSLRYDGFFPVFNSIYTQNDKIPRPYNSFWQVIKGDDNIFKQILTEISNELNKLDINNDFSNAEKQSEYIADFELFRNSFNKYATQAITITKEKLITDKKQQKQQKQQKQELTDAELKEINDEIKKLENKFSRWLIDASIERNLMFLYSTFILVMEHVVSRKGIGDVNKELIESLGNIDFTKSMTKLELVKKIKDTKKTITETDFRKINEINFGTNSESIISLFEIDLDKLLYNENFFKKLTEKEYIKSLELGDITAIKSSSSRGIGEIFSYFLQRSKKVAQLKDRSIYEVLEDIILNEKLMSMHAQEKVMEEIIKTIVEYFSEPNNLFRSELRLKKTIIEVVKDEQGNVVKDEQGKVETKEKIRNLKKPKSYILVPTEVTTNNADDFIDWINKNNFTFDVYNLATIPGLRNLNFDEIYEKFNKMNELTNPNHANPFRRDDIVYTIFPEQIVEKIKGSKSKNTIAIVTYMQKEENLTKQYEMEEKAVKNYVITWGIDPRDILHEANKQRREEKERIQKFKDYEDGKTVLSEWAAATGGATKQSSKK